MSPACNPFVRKMTMMGYFTKSRIMWPPEENGSEVLKVAHKVDEFSAYEGRGLIKVLSRLSQNLHFIAYKSILLLFGNIVKN